jgi:hypothetical protein
MSAKVELYVSTSLAAQAKRGRKKQQNSFYCRKRKAEMIKKMFIAKATAIQIHNNHSTDSESANMIPKSERK